MADVLVFPGRAQTALPGAPADASARREALDPRRSFLVEAPAGSGKTALLIQRFLTLLAQPEVAYPDEVLAITFTRDSTAELRERVLRQLRLAAEGKEPADAFEALARPLAQEVLRRDRELGWQLLDYPRRLRIQTIDGVCAEIARSLPVLSGAGASLAPAEEPRPLYGEAAHRTLMLLGGPDERLSCALETILLHRDADLAETESLIANMLAMREQWAELMPANPAGLTDEALDREVLPRFQKALDQAICRGLTQLSRALPQAMLEELCRLAAEMAHLDGYNGNPSPLAVCANRYETPGERSEHLEHWRALIHLLLVGDGNFRKARGINVKTVGFMLGSREREQLAELIDQVRSNDAVREALLAVRALPPAVYPVEQWTISKALFRVLNRSLAELQVVFAETGSCDFTELSLLARTALAKDHAGEDLALATGAKLKHLLVDEMQDTSTGQYELIQLLTRNWDGGSQTVFLVGDPKQSIYLFREARVERFIQTMQHKKLGDVPLTVLHLTANFRSQAGLIDAFNEDFLLVFPETRDGAQPARVSYLAASATRPRTLPEARHWHATLVGDTADRAGETKRHAAEMRRLIESWRARPLPPGRTTPWRIAVLVRGRAHLVPVVAALREGSQPIPYRAVKIEPLGERQEILDLLALTRALLHPADRTAWLALLRSPLCGLSLDALHRVSGADDRTLRGTTLLELAGTQATVLDGEDRAMLERFRSVMTAALGLRGTMRLSEWVHRTWISFGAERTATPEEGANVLRFLELLDDLGASTPEADDRLDLALLTARLEKLYAAPSNAPDAVELMTIHNSKGLEWDLVLVPSLERRAGADRARLLSWLELDGGDEEDDGAAHGLLAPIQARGEDAAALNRWMHSIQGAREAAEVSRLFYVACTRAREELHLFSATTLALSGEPSAPAGTLLRAALPAAAPYFRTVDAGDEQTGALLVFPAAVPGSPPQAGVLDRLAASAPIPLLRRIPAEAAPALRVEPATVVSAPFVRPPGSYSARAFGNTVHAFLEQLTHEIEAGAEPAGLAAALRERTSRVVAVLRAAGLAMPECEQLCGRVLQALHTTLTDPVGQWIVSPHARAETERSLHAAGITLRPDRTFLAGATPLSAGSSHLWVIDYKTATPGGRDEAHFLEQEREKYAPQMHTYAAALAGSRPVCAALYYPAIPAFLVVQ